MAQKTQLNQKVDDKSILKSLYCLYVCSVKTKIILST